MQQTSSTNLVVITNPKVINMQKNKEKGIPSTSSKKANLREKRATEERTREELLNLYTGDWVAEFVQCPTLAQIIISQFMSSSPMSGSVLTVQSLEPASDSVFPSLFLWPSLAHTPSLKNKC